MPKTTKSGKVKKEELPETLKRSPAKAQRTFAKTHDAAAAEQYDEGKRAHRTAYASLKHGFEKVGDQWEPKDDKGPSDPRSKLSTRAKLPTRTSRIRLCDGDSAAEQPRRAVGVIAASACATSAVSRLRHPMMRRRRGTAASSATPANRDVASPPALAARGESARSGMCCALAEPVRVAGSGAM